jgi:hypothetical protein
MSNELKSLVDKIKFLKKWTVEDVAKSINYSRVHLTNAMAGRVAADDLVRQLKEKHSTLLDSVVQEEEYLGYGEVPLAEQVKAQGKMIMVILSKIAVSESVQTGEPVQSIIMKMYKAAKDTDDNLQG